MEGVILFLAMFAWGNNEFFETATQQQKDGYRWTQLENCVTPEDVPGIHIETPIGNKFICYKLQK